MYESKKLSHGEAMSNIGSKVRASFGLTFGFIFVSYTFFPFDLPPMPKIEDRLVFALECHALTMCIVIHLIQLVGSTRFRKAWNPVDPETAKYTEIPMKILTNTVEQFCLFFPSSLILSRYLAEEQMRIIPIFVFLWNMGRLAFAYGYLDHPIKRVPGFAMTYLTATLTLLAVVYFTYLNQTALISYPCIALTAHLGFKLTMESPIF